MHSLQSALVLLVALPLPAAAPMDFGGLEIKPGDYLFATQHAVEVSGTVTEITPQRIMIDGAAVAPVAGLKIERRGDRPWDAAVPSFLIGALGGATLGKEACLDEPLWHCAVGSGASFAGIAFLIDWLHTGRTTIFDGTKLTVGAMPLGPATTGVVVAIAF